LRVALDACVLFPTVMREMLLGAAATGAFEPVWSARILEEWARASRRLPEGAEVIARSEIARMRLAWPEAEAEPLPEFIGTLSLPDPDDRHVLAAAIVGGAEVLMTLNRADFPTRTLARHGLILREPDGYLTELLAEGHDLAAVAAVVRARGERVSGRPQALRAMLRRAGLPRLGKALDGGWSRRYAGWSATAGPLGRCTGTTANQRSFCDELGPDRRQVEGIQGQGQAAVGQPHR
jgi:predicted nucleic acid-binding protein